MNNSVRSWAERLSFFVLAAFLILLAIYSKQFAYLHLRVAGLGIFVSEVALATVVFFRLPRIRGARVPKMVLLFGGAYLAWGFLRLGISFSEGWDSSVTLMDTLKQSCIFFLIAWMFVPFLFPLADLRRLFGIALLGVGTAQCLGWLGFLLMGSYGQSHTRLMGFPVGNEVLLPLYPLVYLLWRSPRPELYSLTFGQLWLTQFVLYMKRTWVFSVLVFGIPLLLWKSAGRRAGISKRLLWPMLAGMALFAMSMVYVGGRSDPPFRHAHETASKAERENMPAAGRFLLSLIDNVFPYTDPLENQVSFSRIVFKGDLLASGQGVPSMMAFRMHLWRQAWDGFLERPWIGQGFGTHMMQTQLNGLPAVVDGRWISGPHNSFLAVMNRLGLLGLFFLGGLLLAVAYEGYKAERSTLAWILIAAVVNVHFFAFFNVCLENPQGGIWYWLFLGMALRAFAEPAQT